VWYQRATQFLAIRRLLIVVFVIAAVAFALFGDQIMSRLAAVCPAPPHYHADVPPALRERLDALHASGRLYCVTPPEGLATLDGPVYWGTDGVNSLLFFQATGAGGLSVARYALANRFEPGPRGGPPPVGFRNEIQGRLSYANEAPEGATYFVRVLGAPSDTDAAVEVDVRGPAIQNRGLTNRNFWRDMENLFRRLRGESELERRNTTVRAAMPVRPPTWVAVRKRVVAPEFAAASGGPAADKLSAQPQGQPAMYQVLNGPLGAGIWVTGALSPTVPALVLSPRGGGAPVAPDGDTQTWRETNPSGAPGRLASFAFPPLPSGEVYDARYWHDGRRRDEAPPDATFPVVAP
jgi:hypothetical protein